MKRYDVLIVGGGHNGLVAAGYLAAAGLRTLVLEGRKQLGGPAGRVEWMNGYFSSVANSPGSLEPKIVRELELEKFGLTFVKPDPTLVHPLADGRLFIASRDPAKTEVQFESYAKGDADNYRKLFGYLEAFARKLGISIFAPPPSLHELVRNLVTLEDQETFSRVFFGNARDLLDSFLVSEHTKAVVAPTSVVGGQVSPSTPGTPLTMLMRPLSLASVALDPNYDPRRIELRGSTGLAVGGMGAIIDALEASVRSRGVDIRLEARVRTIRIRSGKVEGVLLDTGEEIDAPIVISAINPRLTVCNLIEPDDDWRNLQTKMAVKTMKGKSFKLVLALEGMPRYAQARDDEEARNLISAQFRYAPSLRYLEEANADMMLGRTTLKPTIWGLCPSMTTPSSAPPGKHIMSINVGNAPYWLSDSDWDAEREPLAKRCIDIISQFMPNLPDLISDYRCVDPVQFEREFGLVEGNISHGDTLPWNQFWMRPLPGLHDYRTPTKGLFLSGVGTWPGNFVSGIPGHNASAVVLGDLRDKRIAIDTRTEVFMGA